LLRDLPFGTPAATKARDLVLAWDFVVDKDSAAASVYGLSSRRASAAVRAAVGPASARGAVPGGLISTKRIIDWLYAPDGRFGADPTKGRDALVTTAFEQGVADLTARFGANMANWKR